MKAKAVRDDPRVHREQVWDSMEEREMKEKKRKRKKQRETREEKGAEEVSGNLAAGADVCPGLNRYYILKEYGGAASIASVRAGKR